MLDYCLLVLNILDYAPSADLRAIFFMLWTQILLVSHGLDILGGVNPAFISAIKQTSGLAMLL